MLGAIAIIPSAPVLVPELGGAAAAETADLRAAVLAAAAVLPPRWVVVGGGFSDGVFGPDCAGTFAGFGVDLQVGLSPESRLAAQPTELPLCGLVAGWVRGEVNPEARVQVRTYAPQQSGAAALAAGRCLRDELDQTSDVIGVVVVADGMNTLTPSAPGGYRPEELSVQGALDDALACGDIAPLTQLSEHVTGRVAFQVLAGLVATTPQSTQQLYRGSPYGVGYFVGMWTIGMWTK